MGWCRVPGSGRILVGLLGGRECTTAVGLRNWKPSGAWFNQVDVVRCRLMESDSAYIAG